MAERSNWSESMEEKVLKEMKGFFPFLYHKQLITLCHLDKDLENFLSLLEFKTDYMTLDSKLY